MSRARSNALMRSLAAVTLAAGLGACSVNTNVSVSAATSSQVQHLYVTVVAVWLNTDAAAAPQATGWAGRKLSTPLTLDLATLNSGSLSELVSGVNTPPGTYRQLRLELADSSASLTGAARAAGLSWNAQVQYLDAAGSSITLPLELPSPSSQLIVPVSIVIQGASALPMFAGSMLAGGTTSTTASGTNGSSFAFSTLNDGSSSNVEASPATATSSGASANSDVTTTPTATVAVSSGTASSTASVAVDIQAVRQWVLFDFGGRSGALLSPLINAYDTAKAGGITGTLDVSAAGAGVLTGSQGIVVTAERLSADGTRYEPVKSVAVGSSGAFTLFPLPVADGKDRTPYELVIHGPGIRSVIISNIPVSAGAASSSTPLQSSALKLVKARAFTVNTAANSTALPGGSQVGFFQTVPGFSAPHLIEYALPDPFSGGFAADLSLSADVIDHGSYADGGDISFSSSAPDEGVGTYRIGADGGLRAPTTLSNLISAPTLDASGVQPIFLPAPGSSLGGVSLRMNGTLTFANPGRFDRGFVLISRGGQLLDAADIAASLSGLGATASFSIGSLPAGLKDTRYDVSVRLWNSRDPSGTLTRVAAASSLDAAAGGAQNISIAVP